MKTLKYIIIFLMYISVLLFGCKEKKNDIHDNANNTHSSDNENVIHKVHLHSDDEAAVEHAEHGELPEDIVEMRSDQIKMAGIEMGKVELRHVNRLTKATGIVSVPPKNLASVSTPYGGFVKESDLMPGSPVKKGQVLAIIQNSEFVDMQQQYFEIKNRFDFAEAEYKRHSELYIEEVYSKKNYQQVASEYKSLTAQLRAVEQKLLLIGINPSDLTEDEISSNIAIVSPINGYVTSAHISIGKYVTPSDVLFEIVNAGNLLLELSLFEKDANSVSVGQTVHFSINNETHRHKATVYQVGKSVNSDKTFKVYAMVEQPCPRVLPGMYVTAEIEKTYNQVASVPVDAVVSFEDKDFIFAFEKNKEEDGQPFTEYRFVEVTKGSINDDYIEINLPENFDIKKNKIVSKGSYKLLSAKKNSGEMTCD